MRVLWLVPVALTVFCANSGADWPRFRGPSGNGIVGDNLKLLAKPQELWSASVGDGNASLIVQQGRIYTAGNKRTALGINLQCLSSDTGKVIWDTHVDSWSASSSPTVTKDKGFFLCTKEKPILYCFQLSDGKTIWKKQLAEGTGDRQYGYAGSPTLWRDLVIVNVGLGTALKQGTGEIVWSHAGLSGLATPTLYEEKGVSAVMIFAGDALYARDASTGRELWSIPWKTNLAVNACDPIYHQGKVFINTDYGKYAALFDVTVTPPRQIWQEQGSSFSSGLLHQGNVYCFARGDFVCLDFKTGKRRWSSPGAGGGSVLLAGDMIILLDDRGELRIAPVSPQAFQPTLRATIHGGTTWTPPSLVNGRLYVRNKDGKVVCLRIAS